ncbi:MAG: helix-turn-helix transcriptional regulator [Leptospira sp.]|nr:helix-turn-helix transcriptional regulator [Leptospira sp.]
MATYKVSDILEKDWTEQEKSEMEIQMIQTEKVLEAGNLIWDSLQELGWKQKDLASKLNVSKGYISKLVGGMENLTISNLARVLAIMGKRLSIGIEKEDNQVVFNFPNKVAGSNEKWNADLPIVTANQEMAKMRFVK